MDLRAAIETQGLDPNSAEAKKLWDDYARSRNQPKADLLGDLAHRYFDLYRTWSVRYYAQQLAGIGSMTGEVPSAEQIDRAAEILIANTRRRGAGKMPGWTDVENVNWAAATPQLEGVLSPAQIQSLGNLIERDALGKKLGQHAARLTAQFKGQPVLK